MRAFYSGVHSCLYNRKNSICNRRGESGSTPLTQNRNIQIDPTQSPIKVMFGRPDFYKLFEEFSQKDDAPKDFHVYSTTSGALNNVIFNATYQMSRKSKSKFHHIYEATS